MAELLEPREPVHRLTADERRTLLAMIDAFPLDTPYVPGWGGPHVMALTNYWWSLKPPSHGNYAYLRVRGQEHIALREMRRLVLTTEWGRGR
jgi:hypothetical protein